MNGESILKVVFFQTDAGREPTREWLKSLDRADRKTIGEDIKLIQFRWPLGIPLVRKMETDWWEVRSHLSGGRDCESIFHCWRQRDGTPARLHQEVPKDATKRFELGT